MDASIPVFEKPHPRISVLDWTRNIQRLQNEARLRRFESYELRQRANQLRNETSVTTRWDNYVNNELMRDRIFEVDSWREKQRFTREQVRDEIRALKEEKNATELHLESLQIPLMVVSQCLSNRDQRVPPELTRDQLGEELRKELHIIENSKRVLTDVCHMGWQKIKDLTNVFCRLEREIQNKDDCLTLEYHVKELNRESSEISYKVDPTRIPPDSMTEESYVHCIENTINIAEQLMRESKELRETMFRSREQARNQMYAQSQQVEMIVRRRVYDIQRARNEMEWQKYKLEANMQKVDREIESLRAAVADKINPTKLVETRLETRTRRPVLERVQDKPMRGLIEEYERVHTSSNMLEKKLQEALSTYHGMYNHHQRVKKDLEYKNQALETDRRLIEIRKPLHKEDDTEFKRNVGYCHMADELVTD
ncbi:tektin-B1-like [Maniola jurtina]|uniref:tektin-B1-like n=1 Tax=Maniola jurtina TaxID=191418 RepID=UPI001E689682|nr:tektin-B1-like [Maniola jurtina]XP_045766820.1 tektin-B1-like [Maniola jurtina]